MHTPEALARITVEPVDLDKDLNWIYWAMFAVAQWKAR